jgi:hypothetical protein
MANPVPPDAARQQGRDRAEGVSVGRWRVPAWALVPSAAAPLLLLVGPIVAGSLQPSSFDPVRDSISALAARNATHRGVMTTVLATVGLAHVATAFGLVGAGLLARILLGLVGVSTALVAVFPLPSGGQRAPAHATFAVVAFLILAWWALTLLSSRWGPAPLVRPFVARKPTAIAATAVLVGLLGWFGVEQLLGGPHVGLSERIAGVAESTWPLVVVCAARVAQGRVRVITT